MNSQEAPKEEIAEFEKMPTVEVTEDLIESEESDPFFFQRMGD